MNTIFVTIISTIILSACGRSTFEVMKPAPTNKKVELPPSNPEQVKEDLNYGVFTGCVTAIAPTDPENMETTKWVTAIGCSKVFEASSETKLKEILKAEYISKCPSEVVSITIIGREAFRCTMMPNKPLFYSSNQKWAADTYAEGGINCDEQNTKITIPTLPSVSCVKQKLD